MKRNSMLVHGAPQVISTNLWYEERVETLVSLHNTFGWIWRSRVWRFLKYMVWLPVNIFYGAAHSSAALVTDNYSILQRLEHAKNIMVNSAEIGKLKSLANGSDYTGLDDIIGDNFRRRGIESCVLPWPHFLTGSIFMRKLLDTNDTQFFAPTLVVALVQAKWENYGRPRFTQDLFVYVLSLSLIVSTSFLIEQPGVLEKVWQHPTINTTASSGYNGSGDYIEVLESKRSHVYSLLMAAIMGFLMVKTAIYDVNREFLQYQFG